MPLLSQRRSVFDILNTSTSSNPDVSSKQQVQRPSTRAGATHRLELLSPRPRSEHGPLPSRLPRELLADDVDDEPTGPSQQRTARFSMMKMRTYSESQLSVKAKEHAAHARIPPVPTLVPPAAASVPAIVRTAPTVDAGAEGEAHGEEYDAVSQKSSEKTSFFRRSHLRHQPAEPKELRKSMDEKRKEKGRSSLRWRRLQGKSSGLEDLHRLSAMHLANQHQQNQSAPPSYGDEANSALALPVTRFSESSQSDGSNGSSGDQIYGATTTTTHTLSTHTTFFKLPRRNKNRNSLFPLPVRIPPPPDAESPEANEPTTPRASTSAFSTQSLQSLHTPDGLPSPPPTVLQRRHTEASSPTKQRGQPLPVSSPHVALARGALSFAEPGLNLMRNDSQRSMGSSNSSPLQPPMGLGARDRAPTTSSLGRTSYDTDTPPPMSGSGRNSTSTAGRASLHGFLNLARFRQGSEPHSPQLGSPGSRSKSNSFAISREALVIPEREEGDTPSKYLERLEAAVARSVIAGILSKSADPFAQAVLRSYTRRFPFFGEPIDMSLRKFLLEAELPKETQQVDRVIQAFADRYHECNPGIFMSSDQAYIIAFSLMMLHTDAFNKNNKRKMQKQDYIKNTSGQHVAEDVLGCFYDNICYTPFVHYEEEVDVNGERIMQFKVGKGKLKGAITENTNKKPSGPVDPYNLLVEQKLDHLRPSIKDSIASEDPYNYRGSQGELDPHYLQRAFTHTGVLQIISARSRPAAYENTLGQSSSNPTETQAGIVDLKITKVGTLWRKATKKKKARSPWQEWGAILTGSQLYLFKNAHWAKGLVHQFNSQQKLGHPRIPVIFKPPLHDFKPDALIKTDNSVALVDSTYSRHKHAFTFWRAGGQEEVLLADNESELDDWLALINYAAAFRAAGVRIRGMVGGNEEDLRARDVQRLDSTKSAQSLQTAGGEVTVARGMLSPQLQRQVMAARRQIMIQKIAEIEKQIIDAVKQLENMLRNVRHLLVLAPIGQKTREDVIHAAAKADAMIKWLRRDIWRMKCHRDIIAMDVQLDGLSAAELQALAELQATNAAEHQRREQASARGRDGLSSGPARSPPQSPSSHEHRGRQSTQSTADSTDTFLDNDVFRTPPESMSTQNEAEGYKLPPLQLDVQPDREHRSSLTSTLLSVTSFGRRSPSHASSASSTRPSDRLDSEASEAWRKEDVAPTPNSEEKKVELLARSTITPEPAPSTSTVVARGMGLDGPAPTSTPESNKHKGVRRSLHKTLRDAHRPGSVHKHRRGKDSDGTIRSAVVDSEYTEDGTPRLEREKGRFILHGKQASVIQFGSDWPNDRMKTRREKYSLDNESRPSQSYERKQSDQSDLITSSPIIHDFTHDRSEDESVTTSSTRHSYSLRSDAEAAEAFASSAMPTGEHGEAASYFDGTWDPYKEGGSSRKRQTVIGPSTTSLGNANPSTSTFSFSVTSEQDSDVAPESQAQRDEVDGNGDTRSSVESADFSMGPTIMRRSDFMPQIKGGEGGEAHGAEKERWGTAL